MAIAEAYSNHPIAKSIREAYGWPVELSMIAECIEIAAYGIQAKVENLEVLVGNDRLMHRENIDQYTHPLRMEYWGSGRRNFWLASD